ncbi:transporter substrate-binding domain-containing protein [Streptomyces cyanogenus]|uniref:Major cell-binding factor n=1 Tax=Streptomyces cyanogenus TaxID=80860 RepID=A0ABX7U5E2_STRCY|nr:transporter substrate-binding domain-containing protein [Streptomyces cyanogenus]QTE03082.1 Major cell-binding factor precursor [Streptomyces cyanogenus]
MPATSLKTRSSVRLPGRIGGSAAVLALLLSLASCSSEEPEPEFLGRPRITVATHNDLPGMSYSENYDRSGLDFLVFQHVKEELDPVPFTEPVDVASGGRVTQLRKEKADMVIASFSITAERMKLIDFVGPYLKTRQGFLVGPDSADVQRLSDLRGTRICTWEGTTSKEALNDIKNTAHAEPVVLTDASDCIKQLLDHEVQAVSTDQTILYGFAQHYEDDRLRVVPDVTIGVPQDYGIGLPKGYRKDCRKLKDWLKEYVGTSTWTRDVETSLPALTAADTGWISKHKPSDAEIEARSCRDSISP